MPHPEVLLIPVLMLCDYFLTVAGARLAARKYRDHFKFQHYELNPIHQKAIAQKKWFNPFHLVATAIVTGGSAFLAWFCDQEEFLQIMYQFFLGAIFTIFTNVIGNHLANILLFRRVLLHPEDISGVVQMSHEHVLRLTRFRPLPVLLPMFIAACFSPSPFLWGGVVGLILLVVLKTAWLWKHLRTTRARAKAPQESTHRAAAPSGG